jgi:hypothetical protein
MHYVSKPLSGNWLNHSLAHGQNACALPPSSGQSKETYGDSNVGTCMSTYTLLAMVQGVSSRPLTLEAQVQSQAISCGICSRKSDTGTGFSLSLPFHISCTFFLSPVTDVIQCYKLTG